MKNQYENGIDVNEFNCQIKGKDKRDDDLNVNITLKEISMNILNYFESLM